MAYLVKADLETHIYGENINEITRNDDTKVEKAINAAIAEAKSYLSKYDLSKLFADPPDPDDENLKNKVKDLACWHLVKLSNPNINLELFRTGYEDAVAWLTKIMKGQADPQGWPYRVDDANTPYNESGTISWNSNPKRTNNF